MDTKKIFAVALTGILLVGCGGSQSDEQIISDAMIKTAKDLKQVKSKTDLDLSFILADNGGQVDVEFSADQHSSTTKDDSEMAIKYDVTGKATALATAQSMPTSGELKLDLVRNEYDTYFRVSKLTVAPAAMQSMLDSTVSAYLSKYYSINIKDLYAKMGMPLDMDFTKDISMYDSMIQSFEMQAQMQGSDININKIQKAVDSLLAAQYLTVVDKQTVASGTEYTVKFDPKKFVQIMADLARDINPEKEITQEDMQELEEEINKALKEMEDKKVFDDVKATITVGNEGYITGFSLKLSIPNITDQDNPISQIDASLDITMSDFNQPFEISIPANSEDLMTMIQGYLTLMMGGSSAPMMMDDPMGGYGDDDDSFDPTLYEGMGMDDMSDEDMAALMQMMQE